ncbi:hypothetical protein ABW19_dt0205071 [Dactylella cylindrospora]|nr:hypothetical protein ABW19_dt0205071 [Dactylella cylindrospora]
MALEAATKPLEVKLLGAAYYRYLSALTGTLRETIVSYSEAWPTSCVLVCRDQESKRKLSTRSVWELSEYLIHLYYHYLSSVPDYQEIIECFNALELAAKAIMSAITWENGHAVVSPIYQDHANHSQANHWETCESCGMAVLIPSGKLMPTYRFQINTIRKLSSGSREALVRIREKCRLILAPFSKRAGELELDDAGSSAFDLASERSTQSELGEWEHGDVETPRGCQVDYTSTLSEQLMAAFSVPPALTIDSVTAPVPPGSPVEGQFLSGQMPFDIMPGFLYNDSFTPWFDVNQGIYEDGFNGFMVDGFRPHSYIPIPPLLDILDHPGFNVPPALGVIEEA